MIIFVTGAIGSGKTYAATTLVERLVAELVSLDAIFFDLNSTIHRKRRDAQDRDALLLEHLDHERVVFEGWHFGDWLIPLYRRLDLLVVLNTPLVQCEQRIRGRVERRKAGLEEDLFPLADAEHLENLIKWTRLFEPEKTVAEIAQHAPARCKTVHVNSNLDGLNIKDIQ